MTEAKNNPGIYIPIYPLETGRPSLYISSRHYSRYWIMPQFVLHVTCWFFPVSCESQANISRVVKPLPALLHLKDLSIETTYWHNKARNQMKSLSFNKKNLSRWANIFTIRLRATETKLCKNPKTRAKSKHSFELRLNKFTRLSDIASTGLY